MSPELETQILKLYALNYPPGPIARHLGLRVADVQAVLGADNDTTAALQATPEDDKPAIWCFANVNCTRHLLAAEPVAELGSSNLGLVLVMRASDRLHLTVCTYLVDYLCLGVKDSFGPRRLARCDRPDFLEQAFSSFPDGYEAIAWRQAQAIVLGAVHYARQLGFAPCESFAETRSHLGDWDSRLQLPFGYQGKPFYINGPYDRPRQVLRTLEQRVGRGNFDYILGVG